MARIRSVKPQLRTSQVVAAWPIEVRYFFVLLWGYLDDRGRGLDVPKAIAGDCFPHDDKVTPAKADAWLTLMTRQAGRKPAPLCRYEVDGIRYLHCVNWKEHQRVNRPTPSQHPPCPLHEGLTESLSEPPPKDSVPEMEYGDGDGDGDSLRESSGADTPPTKRGTRLPDDFAVTPAMVAWARERVPGVDGRAETEKFVNYWRSKTGKDATKRDWPATWRNWMLNAYDRYGARASPGGQPRASTTDQRVAAALDLGARAQAALDQQKEITAA